MAKNDQKPKTIRDVITQARKHALLGRYYEAGGEFRASISMIQQ